MKTKVVSPPLSHILRRKTKNTNNIADIFRSVRIRRGELKITSIWPKFKFQSGVAGDSSMALNRSGTNFKGPRSLSNQFGWFFDLKFEIGHFGWTLETKLCTKTVLESVQPKCSISNFRSKKHPNWFERLLGPLKFAPDRSRAIGESPATPDWILNFGQIDVIFNSP